METGMDNYTLRIRRHYSGLFIGSCIEEPGITVMGRDHEEVVFLAEQALAGHRQPGAIQGAVRPAGALRRQPERCA